MPHDEPESPSVDDEAPGRKAQYALVFSLRSWERVASCLPAKGRI
jgi:hypothetical protein